MSDETLEEVRDEIEYRTGGFDAQVRLKYRALVERWGISAPLARLADVVTALCGVGFLAVAVTIDLGLARVLLAALGVILVLGGIFGFINGLQPAEVADGD